MISHVSATFVDGVLQPDEPLDLPNHSRVSVTIQALADGPSDRVAAWTAIKQRLKERPIHSGGRHFTRDELHERR